MIPPSTEWELSTASFTLHDMADSRCLKRGPKDEQFVSAVCRLISRRVVDPSNLSDNDVVDLTLKEVSDLGKRIVASIIDRLAFEQSIPSMRRMVEDVHADT